MGPLNSYEPQNTRINISFIWRVCFSSVIRTCPVFHQDDTWQNNQAVKHQWRLGRIINVSFSLFQCVLL